jgi:hypothetical protein
MPMPPSCAMAIARRASVTVSMAADTSGRFSGCCARTGGERGVLGQDLGERRHQQHIVEGERFAEQAHVKAPNGELYPSRKGPKASLGVNCRPCNGSDIFFVLVRCGCSAPRPRPNGSGWTRRPQGLQRPGAALDIPARTSCRQPGRLRAARRLQPFRPKQPAAAAPAPMSGGPPRCSTTIDKELLRRSRKPRPRRRPRSRPKPSGRQRSRPTTARRRQGQQGADGFRCTGVPHQQPNGERDHP